MLCRFSDEAQLAATEGSRTSAAACERLAPQEQAEAYLYKDEAGTPVIPQPMLLACIVGGGSYHKAGRSKITTQKRSLIYAAVMIEAATIPIESKGGWHIDTRPVRIPATGGRILCHRPVFHDWQLHFEVELDETIISEKLFRMICDDAGSKEGLGAYRPGCKGPFGRWRIDKWQVQTMLKLKKAA